MVSSVPVPQIAEWHDGRYVPGNIVVAAAGNLEHERIVGLVEGAFPGTGAVPAVASSPNGIAPSLRFHPKETEQYHLLWGPGIPRGDERRFRAARARHDPRRSTSSRLFQEVREKRGLAYAVFSYASHYVDTGQVAVYVGTRPDNVGEAMDVIGNELRRVQDDGVSEDELERARENVKGRTVLSMESTLTRMNLGSSVLMDVPLLTVDEVLAAFDAVTLDDVNTLARELWQPELLSAAGVGGDEAAFRSAVEAVSPALAAAA